MVLRIIHTADWHLGHTLHGVSREYEHERFLSWLLDTLEEELADALVVAGDVFDSANPPAAAQAAFYRFLADARRRCPALDVVVVAGNHDSPARLEAPGPLLGTMGVRVTGLLPRAGDGELDPARLLVPLHSRDGELAAWCAAVPYLRPADLPRVEEEDVDPMVEGVRRIYAAVAGAARAACAKEQALVLTGHCYLSGTRVSELSERRILGGNQHALPLAVFPEDAAYVALGHLHLAQVVGGRMGVRYSGSPIPLSLAEDSYLHQVLRVDLEGGALAAVEALPVPQQVEILRLPSGGPLPVNEVVEVLSGLELEAELSPERWPFLEVAVRLEGPEPGLRQRIETAIEGAAVRLLKITPHYTGSGQTLADVVPEAELEDLDPEEVLRRRWSQDHEGEPGAALLEAFHELLETVQGENGA